MSQPHPEAAAAQTAQLTAQMRQHYGDEVWSLILHAAGAEIGNAMAAWQRTGMQWQHLMQRLGQTTQALEAQVQGILQRNGE